MFQDDGLPEEEIDIQLEVGYDREAWETLKSENVPIITIQKARLIGIPEIIIQRFGLKEVERMEEKGDHEAVLRFMDEMKIGTPEDRQVVQDRLNAFLMKASSAVIDKNRENV